MTLRLDDLRASVESLFLGKAGEGSKRIGAELELIPFHQDTHAPISIVGDDGRGSLQVIRRVGERAVWREVSAGEDPPSFKLPGGGSLSFEPGGQLELSTAPSENASALIRDLRCTAQLLSGAFANAGIEFEAIGVDPYNDINDVPLQLHRPRYERMSRFFASIGTSGAKMMRQTASLQLNVDVGEKPFERWSLLNALAPYVTAIFANSPMYRGESTGHQSLRSHIWRTLDASRTGIPINGLNHIDTYFDFALDARAMMRQDAPYDSFAEWMRNGNPSLEDWQLHLSTLFPEVRPREYFELRSLDAVHPDNLAAPIVFISGLVYDDATSHNADDLLSSVDNVSLDVAGRDALRNEDNRSVSSQLVDLSLIGAERLGPSYIGNADLESAADFFDRYTRRGLSPADDRS